MIASPATLKQVAFIAKLATERGYPASNPTTSRDASMIIETLLKLPRVVAEASAIAGAERVTEPGMYRTPDGLIAKVQQAQAGGNLYAKVLTPIGGQRLTESDEVVRFEFQYERGLVYKLTPADRLTIEEAKAFGIRYGICCVCGKLLSDAKSVAEGIGPVCGSRV